MTVAVNDEILRAFGDKVGRLERELECTKLQLTKYEVLSRTRGQRVCEMEQVVVELQKVCEAQAEAIAALKVVKSDAETYIETILAENTELKRENAALTDLKAELNKERQLSSQFESKYLELAKRSRP